MRRLTDRLNTALALLRNPMAHGALRLIVILNWPQKIGATGESSGKR